MKITKSYFLSILFTMILLANNNALYAQQNTNFWNSEMQLIAKPESRPGWIYLIDGFTTPAQDIFTTHASAFGLGVGDEMVLVREDEYLENFRYYSFQQYNQMGLELLDINIERNSSSYTFNTSTLPSGIYLVYLMVNEEVVAGGQLLVMH